MKQKKKIQNGRLKKTEQLLLSYSNKSQINGYQGFFKILMITLISSKKLGVYEIMRNTVVCTIVKCIANVLAK